ncbi:MAG TPA: alpha/beta hydrolase [Acetobacteraceae bacterium]|nr:alpha/beta hydrolase [Acetobacteraceae bacterium]
MSPREGEIRYLLAGAFHRLAYTEWGDPAAPVVLCVHGLTRTGRDFDSLAAALAPRFRVICPDLPGRGRSDWLPDPTLYQPLSYVQALAHLLAAIGEEVAWVGTSLGGICGMLVAAASGTPVTRLVLNDIGPHIPRDALARIRAYLGTQLVFPDLAALEAHLRVIHGPFGKLTDVQWAHVARTSARTLPDGQIVLHYDPGIAVPVLASEPADTDMWPVWQRITVPMLAIRGAESDLLLPETFARMAQGGAQTLVVPETGHAPALMDAPTIRAVERFLLAPADADHPGAES